MHKLSLEGGVGVPQIFKVGTEFQKEEHHFRECYCQIINPGGCHHPTLQAGEGQSRKEPDEEDKRERESLSQGSCWIFILSESPWWGWGEGNRGLSDADISDPSSRSGIPCGGWVRRTNYIYSFPIQWNSECEQTLPESLLGSRIQRKQDMASALKVF